MANRFNISERQIGDSRGSNLVTQVVASPAIPMERTNQRAGIGTQLAEALGVGMNSLQDVTEIQARQEATTIREQQQQAKVAALNSETATDQEAALSAIGEESGSAFRRQYMFEMGRKNAHDFSSKLNEHVSSLPPEADVSQEVHKFTQEFTKGLNDKDYIDGFNDLALRAQTSVLTNAKANRLAQLKEISFENLTADATQFMALDSADRPKTWMTDLLDKGKMAGHSPLKLEANVWSQAAAMAVREGRLDLLEDSAWTEGRGELKSFKDRNRDKYDLAVDQTRRAIASRNKTAVSLEAYNFTNAVNSAIANAKEGLEPMAEEELKPRIWNYISTGVMKQNEGESMMKAIIDANQKYRKYERLNNNLFGGQPFTESVSSDDFRGVMKLAAKKLEDAGTSPEQIPQALRQMATRQGKILPEDLDVMTRGVNTPIGKDGKPSQYTVDAFNMFVQYRKSEHDHLLHGNLSVPDYAFMDKALTLYNQDPSKNVQAAVSTAADIVKAEKNPNLEASYNAIRWDETLAAGLKKVKALGGKNTAGTEEYLNSYLRSNAKALFAGYNGQISSKELGEKLAEKFYGTHVQTPTFWMDATGLPIARKDIAEKGEELDKALRWQFASQLKNDLWNGGKNPDEVKLVLRAAPSNIYTGEGGNYELLIDGKATRITLDPMQLLKSYEHAGSMEGVTEYFAPIEQAILANNGYDKATAEEYRKAIELAHNKGVISSKRRDSLMEMNDQHDRTHEAGVFTQNLTQTQYRIQNSPLFKAMMSPTDTLQAGGTAPFTYDVKRMPLRMVREQAAQFGRQSELALAAATAGHGYSGVPYEFGETRRIGFGYNLSDKEGFIKDWLAAGYASNEKGAEAAYKALDSGKLSLDRERAVTLHQMFQKRIGEIGTEFKDAPPHLQHAGVFAYMSLKNPSPANAQKFFELVAKGDEEGAKALLGGTKSALKADTKSLSGQSVEVSNKNRDRLYELFRLMSNSPIAFQRKLETEWTTFK